MRAIARIYGRLAEAYGWTIPEIDDVTMADVEMLAENWKEAPPIAECVRAALGVKQSEATSATQLPRKTEITQAEYDEMVAGMKANAEIYGRRRN